MSAHWLQVQRPDKIATVRIIGRIERPDHEFLEALTEIRAAEQAYIFDVDSCGGSANSAFMLFDALRGKTPWALVRKAESAALTATMAATEICLSRHGSVMVHSSRSEVFGDSRAHFAAANELLAINGEVLDVLRKRVPAETVAGWLNDGRDHYFDAQQALGIGLVDRIIDSGPASDVPENLSTVVDTPHEDRSQEFLNTLQGFGPFKTPNYKRLFREVAAWMQINIRP